MAARKTSAKTTAETAVVTITGPKRGRRRVGRDFGREPVTIPVAELSKGEIAALKADLALTCVWPGEEMEE